MPDKEKQQTGLLNKDYPDPETRRVQIYTLGRFSLLIDGAALDHRALGKPLEFLQALIALGGRDVSEAQISNALWPDSEGDQAHSAFTTTLSRLRRLIGVDSLPLRHGQLSLDDEACWVDCWALERLLGELDALLGTDSAVADERHAQRVEQATDRVFQLYHGPFLRPVQAGWLLPLRERLRSRFLRAIRQLIRFHVARGGECHEVIALYEKARELEPCSEEICRGLMRCHAAHGNRSQALTIFETCYQMLRESFGIEPSDRTHQLYLAIKRDDPEVYLRRCGLCAQI